MAFSRKKPITVCEKTTHVNHETGEVTSESKVVRFSLPSEPPYVKLYIDDLSKIYGIADGPQKLIHHLVARIDYEGHIALNPVLRKKIADELGIKDQTFRNYLRELVQKNILHRIANNYFSANPYLFAKGEWSEIFKKRKEFDKIVMEVTYRRSGEKTVKTEFE